MSIIPTLVAAGPGLLAPFCAGVRLPFVMSGGLAMVSTQLWWGGLLLAILLFSLLVLVRNDRRRYREVMAEQVVNQRNNEVALQKISAELESLRALLDGRETEFRRAAEELQDGLGGLLTTIKARLPYDGSEREEVEVLLDRACSEVRRIAHDMAPQTLSLSGLSGALEDICTQLNVQGLICELEISGQPGLRLDEGAQIILLRIVRELTSNIVEHAKANKVFIQLLDQPNQILLTVEDDGIGFDPKTARKSGKGLGLSNVDHRAAYLNGKLLYDSSPGHGTTINLSIPL